MKNRLSELVAWLSFVGFISGAIWLWFWTLKQDEKWRQVEAVENCLPGEGQTASVSVRNGEATCAIMGWSKGRRVLVDRRSVTI